MPDYSRRWLLKSAGIAAAATATGFAVSRVAATDNSSELLKPDLEALIASGRYSPGLGDAYLDEGIPRNRQTYERLIEETVRSLPRGDLEAGVARAMAADFEAGRVCEVAGWQLALTECRLAAIACLYRANGGRIEDELHEKHPLDALPDVDIAHVEGWSPHAAQVGVPFSRQFEGAPAVWLRLADIPEHSLYLVYLGSQVARARVNRKRKLIVARFSVEQVESLVATPGEIPIHLVDSVVGKQFVGHLAVRARPEAFGAESTANTRRNSQATD